MLVPPFDTNGKVTPVNGKISVQPNLKTFKDEYKNEDHEENYDLEDVLDDTD